MLRILLMLGLAATAGAAAWQVWQLEQVRAEQRDEIGRLDALTLRVTRALLDIRASQRAYLSPGQGIGFWKPHVDQHLLTLRDDLQALRNSTLSATASAAAADEAALDALGEVTRLERRIAEHVEAGRLEHAADIVYADNIRATLALERAADTALAAHRADVVTQQADVRWREGGILALTAIAGFLLAALVWAPGRAAAAEDATEAIESATPAREPWEEGEAAAAAAATGQRDPAAAASAGSRAPTGYTDGGRDRARPSPAGLGLTAARSTGPQTGGSHIAASATKAAGLSATAAKAARAAASHSGPAAAAPATVGTARGRDVASASTTAHRGSTASASPPPVTARTRAEQQSASTTRHDTAAAADGAIASRQRADLASGAGIASAGSDALHTTGGAARASAPGAQRPGTGARADQPPASAATVAQAVADAASSGATGGGTAGSRSPAGPPTLVTAADLCVSMARAGDAGDLRPLLARVSEQLDAVGVIVWLQDGDGRTLEPALTHGYAADTLAHLRAIDRDADNATARAFRTGQPQKVAGRDPSRDQGRDPGSAGRGAELGAVVVPMLTASGCVGVIAAELRHGREHDPATLALARIVAAQLALLTTAPENAR